MSSSVFALFRPINIENGGRTYILQQYNPLCVYLHSDLRLLMLPVPKGSEYIFLTRGNSRLLDRLTRIGLVITPNYSRSILV